jgi:hypothetical protein
MPYDKPDYTLDGILKSILKSRGASKEKFSHKPPEIKITHPPLSPKENTIILDLEESVRSLKRYNWSNSEEVEQLLKDNYNKLQIQEHIEEIKIAVRAGLIWHPLVADFIYTRKALGSKEILRKIRRGWETGVKRPLTINGLKFRNRLEKIAEYREEGKTWEQIRRILMKGKIINKMSWQALQKKFEKAWEEEWKKVNKKPPPIP